MPPVEIPGLNITLLTGPLIIGDIFAFFLYGLFVVQVCFYFNRFPHDKKTLKAFVSLMFITESLFILFLIIAVWNTFGSGWGDINKLLTLDWSSVIMMPLNIVLGSLTQSFYAWRIRCLTKKNWIPALIICFALMEAVVFLIFVVKFNQRGRALSSLKDMKLELGIWSAGSAVCDLIITISLAIILSGRKINSEFKETSGLIHRLVRFNVETALVTSIAATLDLVMFLAMPRSTMHIMVFFILGELYCNTFIATLNFRAVVLKEHQVVVSNLPMRRSDTSHTTSGVHNVETPTSSVLDITASRDSALPVIKMENV